MDIDMANRVIELSHSVYIESKFPGPRKVRHVPMDSKLNLRAAAPNPENPSLLSDTGTYRFIADRARPDILAAVGELSTGGAKGPSDLHLEASEYLKDYLSSTPHLSVRLGGLGKLLIFGYSDASYVTDGDCKSRFGGCVFMNLYSGAIFSFSRNDTRRNLLAKILSALSHSSTESEIKALDVLILELLHILEITEFIVGEQELPIKIYCDNKSAGLLFATLKCTNRVKHINLRIQAIRELILEGLIAVHFVPTKWNVADILTKPLDKSRFADLRNILMQGHRGLSPEAIWAADEHEAHLALTAHSLLEFDD
jgi:hypothetical protein